MASPRGLHIGEVNWLFNVTINDISVIYVTAHRCAGGLKKLDLRSGSQRHRHFVGFFNVPVLAPTRDHPFYMVIPTHRHLVAFYDHAGDTEDKHFRLNPQGPHGAHRRLCKNASPDQFGSRLHRLSFIFFDKMIKQRILYTENPEAK